MDLLNQLQIQLALDDGERIPPIEEELYFHPERWLVEVCGLVLVDPFLSLVRDIATSWLQMHARERKARGEEWEWWQLETREDLPAWDGETIIPKIYPLQGGHKQGKSVVLAGLLHWLYSVCPEIVGSVYAPEVDAAAKLTWRYVDRILMGAWRGPRWEEAIPLLAHRAGGSNTPKLRESASRSITTTAAKRGTSVQGGHAPVAVHLFEEARGIQEVNVYEAVRSIVGGGISFWFLAENPEDSGNPSQDLTGPDVRRYIFDCLKHPNVVTGENIVPGAVTRSWIEMQLRGRNAWAIEVLEHDSDAHTFELPWRPGVIYSPRGPWWWRVWGVPPPAGSRWASVSPGRYRGALQRGAGGAWREIFERSNPVRAQLGVDVARSEGGQGDIGAISRRWRGCLEVRVELHAKHSDPYVNALASELQILLDGGCRRVSIRVDDGGGYGGAVADAAEKLGVLDRFDHWEILLVGFGTRGIYLTEPESWYDAATQMYADLDEALAELALVDPPPELEEDLCSRRRTWVPSADGAGGKKDVQRLEPKEMMHKRLGRSPDRGDSMALACGRWRGPERKPVVESRDGRRWGLTGGGPGGVAGRGPDGRPIPPWKRRGVGL